MKKYLLIFLIVLLIALGCGGGYWLYTQFDSLNKRITQLTQDVKNKEEELKKLQSELNYNKGFLVSIMNKLSNDSFVNNAPAKVVEMEMKKKSDAEEKIKILEERIGSWK